jgi:hypothetical protein
MFTAALPGNVLLLGADRIESTIPFYCCGLFTEPLLSNALVKSVTISSSDSDVEVY